MEKHHIHPVNGFMSALLMLFTISLVSIQAQAYEKVEVPTLSTTSTISPAAGTSYYLYSVTQDKFLHNDGQYGSANLTEIPSVTIQVQSVGEYYTITSSVKAGYLKSGQAGNGLLWWDGVADAATAQWYITPSTHGVTLDLGATDKASCGSLTRTDKQKMYLFYNNKSQLDFTTDVSVAHEFRFITPQGYSLFSPRVALAELINEAADRDYDNTSALAVYRNPNATASTLQEALNTLQKTIGYATVEVPQLSAVSVTIPEANTAYYLYDVTHGKCLHNTGSYSSGSLSTTPSITIQTSGPVTAGETDSYYCFSNSNASGSNIFLKSGSYKGGYLWWDGSASEAIAQWYLTPSTNGCKLDIGQTVGASCGSLTRTDEQKMYLFCNASGNMDFTTDPALADEFRFMDLLQYSSFYPRVTLAKAINDAAAKHISNWSAIKVFNNSESTIEQLNQAYANLHATTSLVATISSIGYATFYYSSAVTIPEGLEVYYCTLGESNSVDLQAITGLIPAQTGVILKGAPGNYSFTETNSVHADASTIASENQLVGSASDQFIYGSSSIAYYALNHQTIGEEKRVGFFAPKGAGNPHGRFTQVGGKAYLKVDVAQESPYYSFNHQGTTSIEKSQIEITAPLGIYDLQGRRVAHPTHGLYIVNGKKTIIK